MVRSVRDIQVLENVPVLVRASMNEPVEDGKVTDTFRLRRTAETLRYLAERHAKVIVISHIGSQGTETLAPVADALGELVPDVSFFPETIGEKTRAAVREMLPGKILVLENLRRNAGEKKNDSSFSKELAALADVFVQDSFDTCHRSHASIVGVPQFLPSYAGLVVEEEITALTSALSPKHPALAIIGGAKFSTKEPVVSVLLKNYDHVFVGGALANDFLAASGAPVGQSLVSESDSSKIIELLANPKVVIPLDSRVVVKSAADAADARTQARVTKNAEVRPDEIILDHGPDTSALLDGLARKAKSILWNGPLGHYENGFVDATDALARTIAESKAHSVVGGGDTIASIESLNLMSKFSFVSTGGGAMLDFLAQGSLPGIDALNK